jgi:hypothetical protein
LLRLLNGKIMKKALTATQKNFESASHRTPEYLTWHRLFKREFTKFLESKGMTGIDFSKPNHFDLNGFFKDGSKDQIWYFSISDLRGCKDNMLIRTAKHYKDYTSGFNQYIPLKLSEEKFHFYFNQIVVDYNPPKPPIGNIVTNINNAQLRYANSVGSIINTSVNAAPNLKF